MTQIGVDGLPLNGAGDKARKHAVIRFKRATSFPRFSMGAGERWSFVVYGKTARMLEAIKSEDRFEFGGGTGLSADVEIVYEGPADGALQEAVSEDAGSIDKAHDREGAKGRRWQPLWNRSR